MVDELGGVKVVWGGRRAVGWDCLVVGGCAEWEGGRGGVGRAGPGHRFSRELSWGGADIAKIRSRGPNLDLFLRGS